MLAPGRESNGVTDRDDGITGDRDTRKWPHAEDACYVPDPAGTAGRECHRPDYGEPNAASTNACSCSCIVGWHANPQGSWKHHAASATVTNTRPSA